MKRGPGRVGHRLALAGFLLLSITVARVAIPAPNSAASTPGATELRSTPHSLEMYAPGVVLVKPRPGATADQLVVQAGPGAGDRPIAAIGVERIDVPIGQELTVAHRLEAGGLAQYAGPDYIRHAADVIPDDPLYATDQWDLRRIGMPSAWSITSGSPSVVVAVIDTGFDVGHPDQPAHLILGPVYSSLAGDDGCPPEGPAPLDDDGHGTHVTGTIAAAFDNDQGVAGIAPGVSILAIKAGDCAGNLADSDIASAIAYAANNGAQVINMSFGGTGSDPVIADAVSYAWSRGAVLIAAAGNDGQNEDFVPADLPHVLAVAATDGRDAPTDYSNWGPSITVAAPGGDRIDDVGIWSTYAPTGPDCPGQLYCSLTGTSMATPHVAAEAALVLSVAPDLTPSQTVSLIQAAVDPIRACLNPGRYYGSGRIDVPAALNQALLSHHESAGGAATDFALPFRLYLPAIPERSTCP